MTDQSQANPSYLVLARKYRPTTFAELIGQDAMVRTLTNAIAADRLPHAFILTGVRGIGKTSTARIIARALNCIGADGTGGPTAGPCGVCEHCVAIGEDRHVDVLEMDAASRTGVADIRELIDGVRYLPTSARYKIYIIDEVHMLSTPAFNALLKTLEEPPERVKFVFATTEMRKVPVTVVSRCQRFDLRRLDANALVEHLTDIAGRESVSLSAGALNLIARAADGSVRDGLSLLDQAIAHSGTGGAEIAEEQVREMLGLADGARLYDLFDSLMDGDIADALAVLDEMYGAGADPAAILQDLLELTHWLTRLKLAPAAAEGPAVSEAESVRGGEMARALSMPVLVRAWQMLLKGLGEVRSAPSAIQAAEMVLVRLAFAADLPAPAEIVKTLQKGPVAGPAVRESTAVPVAAQDGHQTAAAAEEAAPNLFRSSNGGAGGGGVAGEAATSAARDTAPDLAVEAARDTAVDTAIDPVIEAKTTAQVSGPETFEAVVELFAARREAILHTNLVNDIHLVRFEPGRIEFRPGPDAPADLAPRMSRLLGSWTGTPWMVTVSGEAGAPTIRTQREAAAQERQGAAVDHPLVQAALAAFPGATVAAVHERATPPPGEPDPAADTADTADTEDIKGDVPQ
jgi:DNA polymerase-3 subunit gamma/tau